MCTIPLTFQKYPASNLLASKSVPWKCKELGEKKIFVVLELSEPTEISAIDIGNEHSCFIEVQVGNKGDPESEFKELLLTSSFQTPAESRNSENPNRVRCFNKAALVESTANEKWELVKLICTQPFNSRVQYGIAFLKVYAHEAATAPVNNAAVPVNTVEPEFKKKGIFSIRESSPDSEAENSSSLFSRWKQSKQGGSSSETNTSSPARIPTAAAAIRDARTPTGERRSPLLLTPLVQSKKRPSTDSQALDRNRNKILYDDDDEKAGDEKLEKLIEKDKKRAEEQLEGKKDSRVAKLNKDESVAATPPKKFRFSDNKKHDQDQGSSSSNKPAKVTPTERQPDKIAGQDKPKKPKTYKQFKKLLEGVVLTISGIQNPERSNLRSKALEMGAKYRGDWDGQCTHLICAFRNTPKYNQVQGVGKIVKKDWVLQCHANRKHIPWRRFALDNKEADKSESEGEICDEKDKEVASTSDSEPPKESVDKSPAAAKDNSGDEDDDILMVYDQVDDVPVVICDSGSDTEDEIEKVRTAGALSKVSPAVIELVENGMDTDLFLKGRKFYLDEDNGAVKIIRINAIITKYGG